jgi:hypothetical protein
MTSAAGAAVEAGTGDGGPRRHLLGEATLRRTRLLGFPAYELSQDGEAIASLGRFGWFRILVGSGQRIELADGHQWRIRSMGVGGSIQPLVVDSTGRKVAVASLGAGYYGISGPDYAHVLFSLAPRGFTRADRWMLRDFDEELAVITRSPLRVEAFRPVHLAAVFLTFTLLRYGIPGESAPKFGAFRWA